VAARLVRAVRPTDRIRWRATLTRSLAAADPSRPRC
jgi:hypothetical protein